jgi:glucose-6-phosphate 1-dehydrogenase
VAGKQLDERSAYVKVVFKRDVVAVPREGGSTQGPRELLFHVQGGKYGQAAVLATKDLPLPKLEHLPQFAKLSSELSADFNGAARQKSDPYTTLLAAVYNAQRDRFVATYNLLRSWEVWTPLLKVRECVYVYVYMQPQYCWNSGSP